MFHHAGRRINETVYDHFHIGWFQTSWSWFDTSIESIRYKSKVVWHNFSHMIWIQTGKGLSSKHPNWLFIFFTRLDWIAVADLVTHALLYSFLEIVQQLSEGRELKSRRGQYVKLIQGARITRHSLYREQRGWYLIFLSPSTYITSYR